MPKSKPIPLGHPAAAWSGRVLAGHETVGRHLRNAVERHEYDLTYGAQRGLYFDWEAGNRVVRFIEEFLCHWKGEWAGQPVLLEPWQQWLLIVGFGWRKADGTRRFHRWWVKVARKNGKTLLAAAIGLYLMVADGEEGAEIYAAATKREQVSEFIFKDAWKMAQASPYLRKIIHRYRASFTLVHEQSGSKFQALGSEEHTLDALNTHCALIDEMHAHPTRGVYDKLETSMGARRQPLLIVVTTAGDNTPDTPFEQLDTYAASVVEGFREKFLDDGLFVFSCELDPEDDPFDESVAKKANPNLGVSVKVDFWREQMNKARNDVAFLPSFLRYHCNVRSNAESAWITPDAWDACEDLALDWNSFAKTPCYGGLDLSTTTDLTALALVYPDGDGIALRCFAWCPEIGIEKKAHEDNAQYLQWVKDGWLTATPGNIVDYRFVEETLLKLSANTLWSEIGYDRAKAADVCIRLADAGLPMIEVPQGPVNMTAPVNRFEDFVKAKRIRHDGNPLLRWAIGNARIKDASGGLRRIIKAHSRSRIDPVVATLMALSRSMTGNVPQPSVYAKRGLRIF
jgi:phage terminase large subunit-like protein